MTKINIRPDPDKESRYTHCPFPKHKGKLWEDVIEEDRPYVEWLTSYDCDLEIEEGLYDTLIGLLEEL